MALYATDVTIKSTQYEELYRCTKPNETKAIDEAINCYIDFTKQERAILVYTKPSLYYFVEDFLIMVLIVYKKIQKPKRRSAQVAHSENQDIPTGAHTQESAVNF